MGWSRHDRQRRIEESRKHGLPWYQTGSRGPGGRLLCGRCGTEVPRGRRTYCSPQCADAALFYFYPRTAILVTIKRQGGQCWRCEQPLRYAELHHIIPLAEGGWHERGNVVAVCEPCHKVLNAEQAARAAEARRTAKETSDP